MRASITVRLSRAGFGLLAIWCLGCSSFDVLIDELVRGDSASAGCAMASEGGSGVQSPSTEDSSSGCGCDHCIAVQVDATEVAVATHATPETLQHESGSALSVDREPHVPPPIASIAT